jgi:hypothetical protein
MLDPTPELLDETRTSHVHLRMLNALADAGLRSVGEVRGASDKMFAEPARSRGRLGYTPSRETLGLPSTDGDRRGETFGQKGRLVCQTLAGG